MFQHARVDADFQFDSGNLLLSPLSVAADDSRLSGTMMLAGLPWPQIDFRLHGDRLDLDRYLPAADDGDTGRQISTDHGEKPDRGGFKKQFIHGQAAFDHLKIADIRLEHSDFEVAIENGIIDLGLNSATLYGGGATGHAVLDAGADPMHGSATLQLKGVALAGLLTDMFGWVPITGTGALDLSLTGQGRNLTTLARSLKGPARVTIANGAIHGIRAVPESVRRTDAGDTDAVDREPFDRIQGMVAIDNGMLKNTDGLLTSRYIRANGAGSLDLFTDILDYAVTADIRGLPLVTYAFYRPPGRHPGDPGPAGFAPGDRQGDIEESLYPGKGDAGRGNGYSRRRKRGHR